MKAKKKAMAKARLVKRLMTKKIQAHRRPRRDPSTIVQSGISTTFTMM
jgi:hypothetical protein